MAPVPASQTLVLPQKGRRTSGARDSTYGLPTDVVSQSAARLRVLALLYAFVFVMSGYVPALLIPPMRAQLFSSFCSGVPE